MIDVNIKRVYNIFNELANVSGTNAKKDILKKYEHDEYFKQVVNFLINPRAVTGISKSKIKKGVQVNNSIEFQSILNLFNYILEHNTGSDEVLGTVLYNVSSLCDEDCVKDFVRNLITKSIKLGIDVKTVNSIYGSSFIDTHEVQLGCGRDNLVLNDGEYFYLSQKLNGVRATYVGGELISRQGIPYKGLNHIIKSIELLKDISKMQNIVLDGELIRDNVDGLSDNDNFKLGTGIITSNDKDKSCIKFVIFDVITDNDFANKESALTYRKRKEYLNFLNTIIYKYSIKCIEIVKFVYEGTDQSKIDYYLNEADKVGWEGLMLNKDVPYYCKRHKGLIKIKTFKHSDLRVIGYEEGTGRNSGKLGAFVVDYNGNNVSVGSGFSDTQREEFWKYREYYIGKIVQVKYKEVSVDKITDRESLQFPVFECVRDDKTTISIE